MSNYKTLYLDADTPLLQSALHVQETYIEAMYKPSGRVRRFKNQTVFWGNYHKKDGGWLAEFNGNRKRVGKPALMPDDFEITTQIELRQDMTDHLEEGVKKWDYYIGNIKQLSFARNYHACIGGEGNFRYDLAQQVPYKGHRPDKPILFYEIREEILSKYNTKIEVIDNVEVDDYMSQLGWQNYQNFRKTGKWENVIGYIDKDLAMIIGPYFKFNEEKPKVKIRTATEAARSFCTQMLLGDSTDNIKGLPKFTKEMSEKYGVRRTNGLGEKTAEALMAPCDTTKEMFERVVDCYKSHYGTERTPFETFRGETLEWNYMDYMEENAGLLWLRRDINKPYSIMESLNKLGINPEEV